MKPAIFTTFDPALTLPQALTMIREAGFEVVAIGGRGELYETAAKRSEMAKLLKENRMTVDSVHAPFPAGDRLFALDEDERTESVCLCKTALDAAAELDGRTVAVHLIQPYDIPPGEVRNRMIVQGRRSVAALAAYAAKRGVSVALENGQRQAYDQILEDFLDEFDTEHVGLCYDTGHENVIGTSFRLLERYGHRLVNLHVHDNTGTDSHMLPYEGTIDWEQFGDMLHTIDYPGQLVVESHAQHSQFKEPATFLREARKRAEKIIDQTARARK